MRNNQDNNKITLTDLLGEDTLILKKINVGKSITALDTYCDFTLTLNKSNLTTDLYDSINKKTSKECQELIKFKELDGDKINITFNDKPFAFTISELFVYTSKGNEKQAINVNKDTFSDKKLKDGLLAKLKETIANKMQEQPLVQKIATRKQEEEKQKERQKQREQQEKQRLLQQKEEEARRVEEEKRLQAITDATKAFKEAEETLTKSNTNSKKSLGVFNEGQKDSSDLLEKVKEVQNNFKKLEELANTLNTLKQKAEISAEFKDQKLYADFLNENLKPGALDKQPDFMKGLSGEFYKPYYRLSKILQDNKNSITVTTDIEKILKDNTEKGFAFGGQIENNLKTFFKRLEEEIKKGPENTLQQHCKEVALTLDSDTGTGKTMFMESLLGSTNVKDQYYTNQQDANGEFKKEGLGDLGALIYGKDREKFVINCGLIGFEEIKNQIDTNKDAIIAFDEWHLLTKGQKKDLNSLLEGKNVIKITATPTDVLYKTLKRSDENKDKEAKEKLLSEKEGRKAKVLENVGNASSDIDKLALTNEYCLSIIDAKSEVFGKEISNHQAGVGYEFADIFGENLKKINFNNDINQKPQVIICPPKDGKNVIYVLDGAKYKYQQVDKDKLAKEVKDKNRVFQVFGPSSQGEAKNSRGNIDGGDNGTSSIKNPKILFYSLDNKIVTELGGLLNQDKESLDNKQKAQLVNLINKYDEFIVQAYGRARADTNDIKFKEESAKTLHYQIQAKKAELLNNDLFKTTINGKDTLVDYKSFVDRFNKNLPKEPEKNKIIVQAFLKVASKENNGNLPKVAIEAVGDKSEFNKVYNVIKSLSKEQRDVLMNIGGYDKEGLEKQKTALETIKATIKEEIRVKRDIHGTVNQNYSDFSVDDKIENKITIKIASDGKVSLSVDDKVTQFESKEYLNQKEGEGKKLNDADANAFKGAIEDHIKEINKKEVENAVSEYSKIIEQLKELNLTEKQKQEKKEAKNKLVEVITLNTKLSEKEVKEMIDKLDKSANVDEINKKLQEQQKLQDKQAELEAQQKLQEQKAQLETQQKLELEIQQKQAKEQLDQQKLETQQKQEQQTQLEAKNKELQEQQDKLTQEQKEQLEKERQKLQDKQTELETQQKQAEELKTQLEEQLKKQQAELAANNQKLQEEAANNKKLQDELSKISQKIIQMEQEHSQKEAAKDEKFQTQAELNEKLKAQIAELNKNKGSNGNIDALFENGELKKLYHTANNFDEIGQSSVEFDYGKNYYQEASEQGKPDQDKFDLLRKSIIQSSAIRDKHSILQEVLQEKGLMTDDLKAYKFKSLDKLIDGDKFKPKFEAGLERLGFGKGENGVWTKVDKGNEVTYDTSQPYVKDFLINAYYEENFNKFKETLEASLAKDKSPTLEELKASAIARYNTKQKLEFVEQIVNYQAVSMKLDDNDLKKLESEDIKEKKDDFYKISNLINNIEIKDWKGRFELENKAQEELEKLIKVSYISDKKIIVGKGAEFVVKESDLHALKSEDDKENIVEDHLPNPARSTSNNKTIRVNLGQISSYLELDEGVTASKIRTNEVNGSNGSSLNKANYSGSSSLQNQNIPSNDTKPIKCEIFLMQCIASIKSLIPNSEKVNQVLPKSNEEKEGGRDGS